MTRRAGEVNRITLNSLIERWQSQSSIEKDNHVVISGDEGDGKSHLLCETVLKFHKTNLWDNIIYTKSQKEFDYKYDNLEENLPLGFDEALDRLDRLDWNKVEVRNLVKLVRGKVRKEKHGTFIYNVQLFRDLHGYWRNHRIRFWLELTPRERFNDGVNFAFVMERMRVPFMTGKRDVWLLDENEKYWMDSMRNKSYDIRDYLNNLRKHPFYKGEFLFKPLSEENAKRYIENRVKAVEEFDKPEEEAKKILGVREKRFRGRWLDMCLFLRNTYNTPYKQIARVSQVDVSDLIKMMSKQSETEPDESNGIMVE